MNKTSKTDAKHTQTRFLPKRVDKTLDWLEQSRDDWKDKCLTAKLELKKKTLSVKRLRDGRDKWKYQMRLVTTTILQMKSELDVCHHNIEKLRQELLEKNKEIEDLKKNS